MYRTESAQNQINKILKCYKSVCHIKVVFLSNNCTVNYSFAWINAEVQSFAVKIVLQ